MLLFVGSAVASNSGLGDLRNATGATNGPTTIGQVTSPSIGIINGNSTYSKTTNNTAYTAYFKTDSDTSKAIVFQTRGYSESIDISTSQFHYAASSSLNYAIIGMTTNMNPAHTTISVSGPNATYTGAFVNTNLLFNAQAGELKETLTTTAIFPSSNPGLTAYLEYAENVYYTNTMTIYANHVAYHQVSGQFITTQGRVDFNTTPDNTTIFYLPSPVVKDSSGGSVLGTYRVNVNNGILVVNILVPIAWVNTAVFPIHIDPSTVSTTTATQPITNGGGNNQIIFAQSLWWVFYHSGTNFVFRTSSDGTTWSAASTLRSGTGTSQQGNGLGLEVSGSKFCYTILSSTTTKELVRCGLLNSGGTITLYSSEQTVTFSEGCACNSGGSYVAIGNDSSNNIWVQMFEGTSPYQEQMIEGTSCGASCTWTSQLTLPGGNGAQVIMNLGSTEMAFAFASTGSANGQECIATWSGSAFNTSFCDGLNAGTGNGGGVGVVNVGSRVYIASGANTGNAPITLLTCAYPCASFTTVGTIATLSREQAWVNIATDGTAFVVTYDDNAAPTTTVDYTSCSSTCTTSTNWSGTTTLTSGETSINNQNGVGTSTINNGCAAVAWRAGTSSPYNLRFSTVLSCSGGGVTTTLTFSPSIAISPSFAQSVAAAFNVPSQPTISTVTTETAGNAQTGFNAQVTVLYGAGLYWSFYVPISEVITYSTSSDALSWSAGTALAGWPGNSPQDWSIYSSGTTVYMVDTTTAGNFDWRYGTLTSGGTITWTIGITSVASLYTTRANPYITVDGSGNVWVADTEYAAGPVYYLEVYENVGGSWSNVYSHLNDFGIQSVIPLANGGVSLIWQDASTGAISILGWSGSAWSSPSSPSSIYSTQWSATAISNTIYFVGEDAVVGNVRFWSSVYPFSSVSAETILNSGTTNEWASVTTDGSSKLVAVYAPSSTTMDYRVSLNSGASWGPERSITTTEASITNGDGNTFPRMNGNIGYGEFTEGTGSPWSIRFFTIDTTSPSILLSAAFEQQVQPNPFAVGIVLTPFFSTGVVPVITFTATIGLSATFDQGVTPNLGGLGITLTPIFVAVPCIGCGGGTSTTTITTTSTVTSGNGTTTVTTTPGQIIGGNENDPLVPFLVVLCFIVILVAAVLVRRRNVVNSRYLESG